MTSTDKTQGEDRSARLWSRFEELSDAAKLRARKRLAVIDAAEALTLTGFEKTAAVQEAARVHSVGEKTVWEWLNKIKLEDRADWLPILADRFKGRTATAECDPAAWEFIKSDYLSQPEPTFLQARSRSFAPSYRRLEAEAKRRGWKIPAERTLQRWVRDLTRTV